MDADLLNDFHGVRGDPAADEVRMAVLVARLLDPALDPGRLESRLRTLSEARPAGTEPWTYLDERGFSGNSVDYESLDNSNLAWVLDHRRGIPISLAVVLIRVARDAGHRAAGINFPGHFLVQVNDVLVDPFVMRSTDPATLVQRYTSARGHVDPEVLFAPASPLAVGLRMLNNVKLTHSRQAAWHKALDALDAQLALAPEQPALHLEQGELWRRLGAVAAARAAWERALALAEPESELAQAVRQRLDELGGSTDVVH